MSKVIKKLAIIMLGAPGCGKGTQGEILEKNTGFKRYVMSDLIKEELKPENKLYDRVFKQGILLGDKEIFQIFRKYFQDEKQIIIDGIPRTQDQAFWLYGYLKRHKFEIKLIYLNVDEKKLINRITSRRYCPMCHASYNILTKKPKIEGICDFDSCKLIQREDDTKEVFLERIKTFDFVKEIILDIYNAELITVNGDDEILKVSQNILKNILS